MSYSVRLTIRGTKGDRDAVATKSLTEIVDKITERGGIPIPAHVDIKRGLLN